MVKYLVDILFFLLSLILLSFYPSGNSRIRTDYTPRVEIVSFGDGFQLKVEGQPFVIKGAAGQSHIEELAASGGNTLRVYDTVNLQSILDIAAKHRVMVIADIPIPAYSKKHSVYEDPEYRRDITKKVRNLVVRYKDHPSLLMWNLGNEVNYPLRLTANNFINSFNALIDLIHHIDPDHPVGTTIPSISKKEILSISMHSPQLDVLGYNLFGNIKNLDAELFKISFFPRYFPFYVAEWSHDGPWEAVTNKWNAFVEPTSTKKVEQLYHRYFEYLKPLEKESLGVLSFYWGSKLEGTHTWFSLFPQPELKSEVLRTIESIWQGEELSLTTIGLDYMLVDGSGAYSSKVFKPSEMKSAELKFLNTPGDNLKIKWEIHPDQWYPKVWKTDHIAMEEKNSIQYTENYKVLFKTPSKSGPYRLFAYVIDQEGYFASTNTPFYIVADAE